MAKICFSCFKKISNFAGRCPYCLDQNQGMYGRIFIGILLVTALIAAAYIFTDNTYTINELASELRK
jgi:ABC-type uncharacterized transport system permease subunit